MISRISLGRLLLALLAQSGGQPSDRLVRCLWGRARSGRKKIHRGVEVSEGAGSRVRVALAGVRAVFHRPHPAPETKRGLVRGVRDFLAAAGVRPEED